MSPLSDDRCAPDLFGELVYLTSMVVINVDTMVLSETSGVKDGQGHGNGMLFAKIDENTLRAPFCSPTEVMKSSWVDSEEVR
jgi:hypothetical protein